MYFIRWALLSTNTLVRIGHVCACIQRNLLAICLAGHPPRSFYMAVARIRRTTVPNNYQKSRRPPSYRCACAVRWVAEMALWDVRPDGSGGSTSGLALCHS